jgi:hypothetical protein
MMTGPAKVRLSALVAALLMSVASGSGTVTGSVSADDTRSLSANFGPLALTATRSATDAAVALTEDASIITSAVYWTIPPNGFPTAISDTPAAGFPTHGNTFAILTTGDSNLFHTGNISSDSGANNGGGVVWGTAERDVTILKIDMNVPPNANCLSITFRFFSEEYPEMVDSYFNDAFIAELDSSTWSTPGGLGSPIQAPNNFAFDPAGRMVSVNTASMSAANAAGTTYDGATPLLVASTPVTPGAHSLYLSIFDQGNPFRDSAVALDSLVLRTAGPGGCVPEATPLSVVATTDKPNTTSGSTNGYSVTVHNPNATALSVNSITATLPDGYAYIAGSTTGITTDDPGQDGFDLTWAGPFSVPGTGSISLRFNATTSSETGIFFLNASAVGATTSVVPSAALNVLNGVALGRVREIDGDGKSDLTVFHPSTGLWYARQSSNLSRFSIQFGGPGYIPVAYDYDEDGKSDIAVYHPPSGLWFVRQSSTGTTVTTGFGGDGYQPVPGDFDRDGKADLAVFHESTGLWFVLQSSTGTSFSFAFGGSGAVPMQADYDGDAQTDFAVYYPASGLWFIRSSLTGTTSSVGFGGTGYAPVKGDFDGDGRSDVAVYDAAAGWWFVRNSSTGVSTIMALGTTGARPVPSDFDGDGKTDPAVYYPESYGPWYVKNSSTGFYDGPIDFGGYGYDPIY